MYMFAYAHLLRAFGSHLHDAATAGRSSTHADHASCTQRCFEWGRCVCSAEFNRSAHSAGQNKVVTSGFVGQDLSAVIHQP